MNQLRIHLFGKFDLFWGQAHLPALEVRKVEELLCFLALFYRQNHTREIIADHLWTEVTTQQSKNYLRKALWQLKNVLDSLQPEEHPRLLVAEGEWIGINPNFEVWTDVLFVDKIYQTTKSIPANQLSNTQFQNLEEAFSIYRGELLEGWYQDWVIIERERLRLQYSLILEKLIEYAEHHQKWEDGIQYAENLLRQDRAHERTQQALMRLYYKTGDRTRALRQYEKCKDALDEELGIKPSQHTEQLRKNIMLDSLDIIDARPLVSTAISTESLRKVLTRLTNLNHSLSKIQAEVQEDLISVQQALHLPRK